MSTQVNLFEVSPVEVRHLAENKLSGAASLTTAIEIRKTKKQLIEDYFITRIGQVQSSFEMHMKFGQAFRSRVSDINRDSSSPIRIVNETKVVGDVEQSTYMAELRRN
jgi:hypothetical protein